MFSSIAKFSTSLLAQVIEGTVLPCDDITGRLYHIGLKRGECANRVIFVGDLERAKRIAETLDDGRILSLRSSRGFLTLTGTYKGTPVSIMGTGMGYPNTDFALREIRTIVDGEMAVIRLGTCGTPTENINIGSIAVSDSSLMIWKNPDAWEDGSNEYYRVSRAVMADPEMTKSLYQNICKEVGKEHTFLGMNASADSFYSSQGRATGHFDDKNETLLDEIQKKHKNWISLEMESYNLLELAGKAKPQFKVRAGNALIVLAQRRKNEFLDYGVRKQREMQIGKATLETLIKTELADEMNTQECCWHVKSDFQTKQIDYFIHDNIEKPAYFLRKNLKL